MCYAGPLPCPYRMVLGWTASSSLIAQCAVWLVSLLKTTFNVEGNSLPKMFSRLPSHSLYFLSLGLNAQDRQDPSPLALLQSNTLAKDLSATKPWRRTPLPRAGIKFF